MRFADVVEAAGEREQEYQKLIQAASTAISPATVNDAAADYCGHICVDLLLERVADFLDQRGYLIDDNNDSILSKGDDISGEDTDEITISMIIIDAEQGKRLVDAESSEAIAESVLETTLQDAGFSESTISHATVDFEAKNIVDKVAYLLVRTIVEQMRSLSFKVRKIPKSTRTYINRSFK